MDSEPDTPTQSQYNNDEDSPGPGLFLAGQPSHSGMEKATAYGEVDSRSSSEQSNSDRSRKDQSSDKFPADSQTQNTFASATATPSTSRPDQGGDRFSTTPAMAPPPKPIFKATPTSAQPSHPIEQETDEEPDVPPEIKRTGSRPTATTSKNAAKDTAHNISRKRSHAELENHQVEQDDSGAAEEFSEPSNPIATFDWMDLEARYHQQMNHYSNQEAEIHQSFSDLCNYFFVWANTGAGQEVDRSFKRLKTQITLVQHHEDELESKRQHYVKVVEAFKTVADILNDAERTVSFTPTATITREPSKTQKPNCSHTIIADAYNWDDVHPSRCFIL